MYISLINPRYWTYKSTYIANDRAPHYIYIYTWKTITLRSLWVDRSLFQIWWSGRDPGLIESHDYNHDQKKHETWLSVPHLELKQSTTSLHHLIHVWDVFFRPCCADFSHALVHRCTSHVFRLILKIMGEAGLYGLEERFEFMKNLHSMVMFGHIVQWYVWNLHIQNPHCRLVCVWNVPCLLLKSPFLCVQARLARSTASSWSLYFFAIISKIYFR